MTNEERFLASCVTEGESGVRQKLNAGRYSERRSIWAGNWLALIESGKSDATKAEETSSLMRITAARPHRRRMAVASVVFLVVLAACTMMLFRYG